MNGIVTGQWKINGIMADTLWCHQIWLENPTCHLSSKPCLMTPEGIPLNQPVIGHWGYNGIRDQ